MIQFSSDTKFELRICDSSKLDKRELTSEKSYWKKFYQKFTDFLYKKGCHDNYVGANIKVIRVFFNYLKNDKDMNTGDFQRLFYVRKEEIEIFVLSPDQLKFLIHDKEFEKILIPSYKRIKDIFVFGCSIGLRYSDIFLLTNKNFERIDGEWYLKLKSKKTKTFSFVKLSAYAIIIFQRYTTLNNKATLFGKTSLFNFNKSLKHIGELAGFHCPYRNFKRKAGKNATLNQKDR